MLDNRCQEGAVSLSFRLAVKRLIDIVASGIALILLSPLLLGIAIAVKVTSPGPLFYVCHWVGKNGRRFDGYKFRTMVVNAAAMEADLRSRNEMKGPAFKITNDPRVTKLGRLIRPYSLDELPQLWSVFKGDLSLVGPRPPRVHEYERFTDYQKQKLAVKPGITCLWQIEGRHRINDYDDWVARDLEYIRTWSLALDMKILLLTIPAVIKGTGI
jgi:lipopolysaccharide/colanic/teichoic acid biosynthesis glycosyltransferase